MKTVIESQSKMFIIDEYMKPIKDPKTNKYIPSEKSSGSDGVLKCKGEVYEIQLFYPHPHPNLATEWTNVKITANEIKALHKKILEIEKKESDEFWDGD